MSDCLAIQPLLSVLADGEACAGERVRVRRHVQDCTACRILLARELRLSDALESIRAIDVDEAFAQRVMRKLPREFQKRRRDRRGLKLAGFAGMIGLALASASAPSTPFSAWIPRGASPSFLTDTSDPAAAAAVSWLQWVLMALQSVAEAPFLAHATGWVSIVALVAVAGGLIVVGLTLGSTIVALAAGALLRPVSKREPSRS